MNIFYIPENRDFLKQLAVGIKTRNLENAVVLLPTQKACDRLATEFASSADKPVILSLKNLEDTSSHVIYPLTYKLLLAQALVKRFSMKYSDAILIAVELHKIIAKFERDNVPLTEINNIKLGDAPQHIQRMVDYLKLIADKKLEVLPPNTVSHLTQRNNAILKLQKTQSELPIIAAGLLGNTMPVASLLSYIARLKNGFVVLQGMDTLPENSWHKIDELHHSFLMKALLDELGLNRTQVQTWNHCHPDKSQSPNLNIVLDPGFRRDDIGRVGTARHDFPGNNTAWFLTEAMCPAEHSVNWHKLTSEDFTSLDNIEYVECKSLQEEALVIALKLEELKKHKNYKTVAVITNETNLLKHLEPLSQLLKININDSFGISCSATPQINFIYALFDACAKDFAPVQLLSLLKHQFYNKSPHQTSCGLPRACLTGTCNDDGAAHGLVIERLELKYLRGICKYTTLEELIELTAKHDEEVAKLLQSLATSCADLMRLLQHKTASFSSILNLLLIAATNLSSEDIWQDDTGKKVKHFLEEVIKASSSQITMSEFKAVLHHCLHGKYIDTQHTYDEQLNVDILSPIESRLLHFDYVILAGLNEKSWPTSITTDPWLISNLPKDIGLSNPYIQTGQAAHDFFCLMHHQNALITRSEVIDNSPQIPSRWLVRLETLAKKIGKLDKIKPNNHYLLSKARSFYLPERLVQYTPPSPKPSLSLRPRTLSVTQIENLIRDPYSIYVSKILNLKKLDAIDKVPTYLEFGNFIHKVIDRFNKTITAPIVDDSMLEILMSYAREELRHISTRPVVAHMWIPRFEKIALWLLEFEKVRRFNDQTKIYSEIKGNITLQTSQGPFTLIAKADRIEINKNLATIIDFKTGAIPTKSEVLSGFSPQLSLEALIATKHGFNMAIHNVEQQLYIQLSTGSKLGATTAANADIQTIENGVKQLLALYMDENTPYLICPNPDKQPQYNEFEHLERSQEWSK